MDDLRQSIENMTKEELIKFIIVLIGMTNLPVSVVNDILGDMG